MIQHLSKALETICQSVVVPKRRSIISYWSGRSHEKTSLHFPAVKVLDIIIKVNVNLFLCIVRRREVQLRT
jgi:hypothetical protein